MAGPRVKFQDFTEWFEKKRAHIRAHPDEHRHQNKAEIIACCTAPDGSVDIVLWEEHKSLIKREIMEGRR